MANYATLKSAIQNVIKTNGNNEIAGALLQQSLLAMIDSLGVGYQYMGIATPSTNPGTPDQRVFYLASQAGVYSNFGGVELSAGVSILYYNSTWNAQQLFSLRSNVSANSQDGVTSKGIATAIAEAVASVGYEKLGLTASRTIAFPIKAGETIIINKLTAGGANGSFILRKEVGQSSGEINIGSAAIGQMTYTATEDFGYLYIYIPHVSGTFEFEIFRSGSALSSLGYQFAGMATPSTNPGTPGGKVFYLTNTAGTYTNFGGLTVSTGLTVLLFDGSAWSNVLLLGVATAINYAAANRTALVPNDLFQQRIGLTDAKIGNDAFSITGSTYIVFPIRAGEKFTIQVTASGGSGSSLNARNTTLSTGQELICALSAVRTYTFEATADHPLLYAYVPNISGGTCTFEIIRDAGLYNRVSKLEVSAANSPKIYYSVGQTYDGYHNAKRVFVFVNIKDDIFVRFRVGLYRPGLSDTSLAHTYWRLQDSQLFQRSGDGFVAISELQTITTFGENEFVIRQTSPAKTDFTGGYHGNEFIYDENGALITGAFGEFFADGALVDLSQTISLTPCNSFFYKERSVMVETANSGGDPTNVGRQIAWHEKRTEFIPGKGYECENRLDFVENVPFYAFGGICCIARWISEYAMGEGNPLTNMGSGTPRIEDQFSNYGNRLIFYKGNGYSAKVTSQVIFGDDDDKQHLFVLNVEQYNKYYRQTRTLTDVTKFKSKMSLTIEKL